jgi:hypothetical protein
VVHPVDRLEVEHLVRLDGQDVVPFDAHPAGVARVELEPTLAVGLDLAGEPVAVQEDDHVGLLREGRRRTEEEEAETER